MIRTLLVDDEPLARAALRARLASEPDITVVGEAGGGVEAVALILAECPDLVLLDVQMPELDGLTAIRRLRGVPELRGLPIVALTALAMPGDRERCLAAGADDYIPKPMSLRTLLGMINTQLQRA